MYGAVGAASRWTAATGAFNPFFSLFRACFVVKFFPSFSINYRACFVVKFFPSFSINDRVCFVTRELALMVSLVPTWPQQRWLDWYLSHM